jgi:hypothetical protein
MWVGICSMLAVFSGWKSLSSRFPSEQIVDGERFRFASAAFGQPWFPVNYSNCLFFTVAPTGLRLSILFLFRPLSPPMFIPWSQIESVSEQRFLFMRSTVVRFRDHWSRIRVYGSAGQYILRAYERANPRRAP